MEMHLEQLRRARTTGGKGMGVILGLTLLVGACREGTSPVAGTPADTRAMHSVRHVGGVRASDEAAGIEVFAPAEGDRVGVDGIGWFVDLAVDFSGNLRSTGFTGNQLTGGGVHNNVPPFPGTFSPGKDDRFGGLVVLISTTSFGAKSCQNLANLFSLTGPTNFTEDETEIWDTWIIGTAGFGRQTQSTLYVAEAADLNGDGIHNDAPATVSDSNHDGECDEVDLEAFGLDSGVTEVGFFIR